MFVINLSAAVGVSDDVEIFDLQVNFEFNFLPIGIVYNVLIKNANYLFKHFDNNADEDNDSNVKMCQQTLKHNIVTLIFTFRINFVKRNFDKTN